MGLISRKCERNETKKRDCCVDMSAEVLTQRWQHYTLTINGDQHSLLISSAVSEMLGAMVDVLYELYLESNDDSHAERVKYLEDDPASRITITGATGSFTWDNEGDTIAWTLTRRLYQKPIMLDVEADYDCGEKVYQYRVPYFDMCYAVAKAATSVIAQAGIVGYHFMSEIDKINIHHLLYIKHLGIFEETYPFTPACHDPSDRYSAGDRFSDLSDEIELLRFEL